MVFSSARIQELGCSILTYPGVVVSNTVVAEYRSYVCKQDDYPGAWTEATSSGRALRSA